jgi:hypothetical protein
MMAMPDKDETAERKLARLESIVVKVEALEDIFADYTRDAANPILAAYRGLIKAITDEMDKQVLVDYWEQRANRLKR